MSDALKDKMKIAITAAIIGLFIWFLVVSPMITFHRNEKKVEEAAKRYFDLYSNELPTGERVKTVSLITLYDKAFMKEDVYIPYTKKTCSVNDSWVKVRKVNGEYKYYTYLKCGVLNSTVDHKGPEIKLYGDEEMTVNRGEKYKEPGVKSVVDNSDGKMSLESVTVKGKVDTSEIGTYDVQYVAFDSLSNKTVVTRTVTVVQKLGPTVKKATGNVDYYVGDADNNYIYFSNMLFRIIGSNGNNVKIIADKDIANVNYEGIDEWFKYYEKHLTDEAKKLIVKSKYCDMGLSKGTTDTTQCNHYGTEKNFGLISIDEINKATPKGENSFLMPETVSWIANIKNAEEAYTVIVFSESATEYSKKHNYGVRPVITIDGETLIKSGDGTEEKPYILTDYKKVKKNTELNKRYPGEYITYGGVTWRIIETNSDGTTKVICDEELADGDNYLTFADPEGLKNHIYNPEKKDNVGYFVNNHSSEYIDTGYFVTHEIKVPIYEKEPMYKKEVETKKYTVKLSAPNMYEMFSASPAKTFVESYGLINSSKDAIENPGVDNDGVVLYSYESTNYQYGVRPVAYFDKRVVINGGKGTENSPFKVEK
ncbi:MAG: DUF5011 domain-containing protein [Bacilli bacterium]|nr:DUF5011 domain-containing protein [Bacilli bacterium]